MIRLLLALLSLVLAAQPARADDISAAGRSVVRVVVIAFGEDGEVTDFGHGSGFAVAPNRIVTNAHVVELAARRQDGEEGGNVAVGVVPSEGSQAYRARIVAVDPSRDLALIEMEQGRLPPIPLFVGPIADGAPVAALGYPGNVDLATARSSDDYIRPLPPTRSIGIFSNVRPINGIATLLHTANIARGHSGGPLLDQCGRVLGVNTLITRNQEGDSTFAFAVGNREVTAFLREARQNFASVTTECVAMADRLRQDQERTTAEEQRRQAELAAGRQQARERAMAQVQERRETRLAIAVLLLVLSLLAFGGAGILLVKNRQRPAMIVAGLALLLLIGAVIVFFTRPGFGDIEEPTPPAENIPVADAASAAFAGRNSCELVPERSRVTVSSTDAVPLEWNATGCVNQRTQYARNGDVWRRILVPEGEQAVAVAEVRPAAREYVVTRYLLDGAAMARVRSLRRDVDTKACTGSQEERTVLADQQREIEQLLPQLPNERLVYRCRTQGATPAASGLSGGTG